jgi:hypothetical protein
MRTSESFFSRHLGDFREFPTKGRLRALLLLDVPWVRSHSFEAYLSLATIQNDAEA